jgi:hypothetical protein
MMSLNSNRQVAAMIIRRTLARRRDYSSIPANPIGSIANAAVLQSALRSKLITVQQ